MATSPRPPVATVRSLVAGLTLAGGALHFAVAPGRSADWRAEGIALAATGAIMMALAAPLHWQYSSSGFAVGTAGASWH